MEDDIPRQRLEEMRKQIATLRKPVKKELPPYPYPKIDPIICPCGKQYNPHNPPNVFGGFCWDCDTELFLKFSLEHKPKLKKDEFLYEVASNKVRFHHNPQEEKKRKIETAFTPKSRFNTVNTVNTGKKPKIVSKVNK